MLAHEVSHIQNLDPEFNRAVFCSVTLLMAALSILSFAAMAVIFVLFLALSCFRSWLNRYTYMAFRGTTHGGGRDLRSDPAGGSVAIYRTPAEPRQAAAPSTAATRYSCNWATAYSSPTFSPSRPRPMGAG